MRYLLCLCLLLIAMPLYAQDVLIIDYPDTLNGDDTAANQWRYDTLYSSQYFIRGNKLCFYSHLFGDTLIPSESKTDTNWTADTFFVKIQHSFNRSDWGVWEIDTLLDTGRTISPLNIDAADSVFGPWMRAMFIHKDSMEAAADIQGNIYSKTLWLYFEERQ